MKKLGAYKIILMAVAFMALFGIFGCKRQNKAETKIIPAEARDEYRNDKGELMLTFELTALKTRFTPNREGAVIVSYTLSNELRELSVTKAALKIEYLGDKGEVLTSRETQSLFRAKPIAPGEKRAESFTISFNEYDRVCGVKVSILQVADQSEIPPYLPPIIDSYLFDFYNDPDVKTFCDNFYGDMPVKLKYFKANRQESETDDPEIITAVFEALKKVKIGGESAISVTDSEIYFTFVMADGRSFTVAFESQGILRYNDKIYCVKEDGGVFNIMIPE